jgi:tetratricopeptide (TPR) repeat protein
MPSAPSDPSRVQGGGSAIRLDSWKEIAAYLGRGERTAKRWESERSLPVHRLPGGGRGSVYALTSELDEWLTSAKVEELTKTLGRDVPGEDNDDVDTAALIATPPQPETLRITGNLPLSAPARGVRGWYWRIPLLVFLFAGLVLPALILVNTRTSGAHHSPNISPLPPKNTSVDAEKQLAHELCLHGRFEWNKRTPDSLNRALDDFTQAVVHDPTSAEAFVGLADTYNLLREDSLMPESEAFHRGIAASRRAIELDDSLAEAHRSMAFGEFWGNWNFKTSEQEFRRAIQLNPRDPLTHLWFANAFNGPGWYSLCLHEIDRAQELDPGSPAILADKGLLLIESGQTERGIDLMKEVERANPDYPAPHRYLANLHFAHREYSEFLTEEEKLAELTRDPVLKAINSRAKEGFRSDGERGLLQQLYNAQQKYYANGTYPATFVARTCVRLGRNEEALRLLREDFKNHGADFLYIRQDMVLAELKDEPGYRELIRDMQFPEPDTDTAANLTAQDSAPPEPAAR